jgi:hypothetical protein
MDVIRNEVIPYQWEALNDRISDAPASHLLRILKLQQAKLLVNFLDLCSRTVMWPNG